MIKNSEWFDRLVKESEQNYFIWALRASDHFEHTVLSKMEELRPLMKTLDRTNEVDWHKYFDLQKECVRELKARIKKMQHRPPVTLLFTRFFKSSEELTIKEAAAIAFSLGYRLEVKCVPLEEEHESDSTL